jgi:3'-5' exoribonuclease
MPDTSLLEWTMIRKVFIADLVDLATVQTTFLVTQKAIRETKNGAPYLNVTLQDRTGSIEARAWDNAQVLANRFDQDDFVVVRGRVGSFRDQLQITIADIERVEDSDVDPGDYLPQSRWPGDALFTQLVELLNQGLKSGAMRRFFDVLFSDEDLRRRYILAPAAVSNHHNFISGLIEHTLSMARLAHRILDHYERYYPGMLNGDLVLAGCVLHDMGKIDELGYRRGFEYTTEGRLVGHIVRGVEIINETALRASPPFDPDMLTQLKHMVLSHHGKLEYGSPTVPKMPEALLLHEIDMLDSRMNMCWNVFEKHQSRGNGSAVQSWTDYQRLFDSSLYVGASTASWWCDDVSPLTEELVGPGQAARSDASAQGEAPSTTAPSKNEPSKSDLNLSLFNE